MRKVRYKTRLHIPKKIKWIFFFLFLTHFSFAQKSSKLFRTKIFDVKNDTIQIDSLSINPQYFKVLSLNGKIIPKKKYIVNFTKSQLIISNKEYQKIKVEYFNYPEFITKTYTTFNEDLIVPTTKHIGKLYSLTTNKKKEFKLFDGLKPKGFIARGLTTGNNQNAVTNSSLDLTLNGKLSEKVWIKANIYDTNFPLQENGYSQNITDFDRIFVELYSKKWRLKGGDLSLENDKTIFLNFEKQVSGVEVDVNANKKALVSASGAIVRGRYSSYNFVGTEGNQGPYKIIGQNNELNIIIVGGSERVFVNGIQLKRGKDNDYIIDYNLSEIRFNTTYPITNDMRIRIEYQFSDKNYTRFVTYEKAHYENKKMKISGYFYNETDSKNQPLQQSLTNEQKQLLTNAGNDTSKMISESAYPENFSEDRILYKKASNHFIHSSNKDDILYNVSFTNVGTNKGDYEIDKSIAIGTIYKYVGKNIGRFNPTRNIVAPNSLQMAVINTEYNISDKTKISGEWAYSNNDKNLFSEIDDKNNKKNAGNISVYQVLIDKKWNLSSQLNYQFIENNFQSVERFQSVEFNRDWNLISQNGNQKHLKGNLILKNNTKDSISYQFEKLNLSNNFKGTKHSIFSKNTFKKTSFLTTGSFLNNSNTIESGKFSRCQSKIEHGFKKYWIGGEVNLEKNKKKLISSNLFSPLSHQFKSYESYIGVGDSIKIYGKLGFVYRENDSIKNNEFTNFNTRKTLYFDSKLIENKKTNLSVYTNYRFTKNSFLENEKSLNSRVFYSQKLFNDFINLNTIYETSSGNISRQQYNYIKTEPGKGFYTWIDYNSNGIKEFQEFEVAKFQDQANYLRITLPNIKYLPTQSVVLNQSLNINPTRWKIKNGARQIISHFFNQTNLSINNQQLRKSNLFNFNPFNLDENKLVNLQFSFRNNLFFNKNLGNYSCIYSFGKSENKQQYSFGNQKNNTSVHEFTFNHKLSQTWLLNIISSFTNNKLTSENFNNRNFNLDIYQIQPKLTYSYNKYYKFSLFFEVKRKENKIDYLEELYQKKIGVDYLLISKKQNQISANLNMFFNSFEGNSNSPIGYQMLEGLQNGKNYTWNLLIGKKLNSLLQLNFSYFGRKSESSKTIHTGNVELKAIF